MADYEPLSWGRFRQCKSGKGETKTLINACINL